MSPSPSSPDEGPPTKKAKTSNPLRPYPTSIVTWNCNGFTSRCLWNANQLQALLVELDYPDLICIQEARLKAKDSSNRQIPMASEYHSIQETLQRVIEPHYKLMWSLADKKYAGTLTLVHERLLQGSPSTSSSGSTSGMTTLTPGIDCAFSMEEAIGVLLHQHGLTRDELGLPKQPTTKKDNNNSSGCGTNGNGKKQTSMKSFFAPKKKTTNPSSPQKRPLASASEHDAEGRFQFYYFKGMDILQTYVPNNGTKEESFRRRREWDEAMLTFLKHRQQIQRRAASRNNNNNNIQTPVTVEHQQRPLLWCGDLNVAHTYRDGTHWDETKRANDGGVYEWWRDESKCLVGKKNTNTKKPEDVGIPSFTPAERRRFGQLLETGNFLDVWRELHPHGDPITAAQGMPLWERPNYTWRGHLAKTPNSYNIYQGKGQRLDYFLLSPSTTTMLSSVESCNILGHGTKREGHFCGSDHCASILRLKDTLQE